MRRTFSSPAAYSLRSKRGQSPDDRRPPKGLVACAISSRSTHSTLTGASCIAVEMEAITIVGAELFSNNQSGSAKLSRKILRLGQSVLHR
jgi:hypothetical protein